MGIEVARRALQAQQRSLEVAGHNIANANTPGYSRQRAILEPTRPLGGMGWGVDAGAGQLGTGVRVAEIARQRDAFIDAQLRNALQSQGEWELRHDVLSRLELVILEPTDVGLRNELDRFWQALQNLHLHPDNEAERAVVRERAVALTETFHHLYRSLGELRLELDRDVVLGVQEINSLIDELGELNRLIRHVTNVGMNPNDLMDRRDLVLRQLSHLTQVAVFEEPSGVVRVSIAGYTVVDEWGHTRKLETEGNPLKGEWTQVKLEGSDHPVVFRSGRLAGLMAMRDGKVPELQANLDAMARALITEFNAIHEEGFDLEGNDGEAFFVGNDATTIGVSERILDPVDGLTRIAAGYVENPTDPRNPGNGANALRLANLRFTRIVDNRATLSEYWAGVTGALGVDAQKANQMVESQGVVVGHLERQREQVSGVNLDEEMADMVRFQHAYAAAARLMTAVDEIIETIVNRMGLVGR